MKKFISIFVTALIPILVAALAIPTSSHADQIIEVAPMPHDFGDVQVGSSSTAIITIWNHGDQLLIISGIEFREGSSPDFLKEYIDTSNSGLPPSEDTIIAPTDGGSHWITIEITYAPSDIGVAEAVLDISSNDPYAPLVSVPLRGKGVSGEPLTIEDIISFFDQGVDAGTIQGTGRYNAGKRIHLRVFEWNLFFVAFFVHNGAYQEACTLLWKAYYRSDGETLPVDFVQGEDVPQLNAMILQLISNLGCAIE